LEESGRRCRHVLLHGHFYHGRQRPSHRSPDYLARDSRIQQLFKEIADTDSALASITGHSYTDVKDPLLGMSDADFASGTEVARRSISGMAFFLFGCLICWRSKLQPFTAKSTHAAELVALSFAADEGIWLRRLLLELGFVIPHLVRVVKTDEAEKGEFSKLQDIGTQLTPPILCDNKGTVFTANNPSTDLNNKALEVRWFSIRDYVRDGLLRIFHIGTNLNVADFFTKPLAGDKFVSFRNFLMGDYTRRDEIFYSVMARFPRFRPPTNPSCQRFGKGYSSDNSGDGPKRWTCGVCAFMGRSGAPDEDTPNEATQEYFCRDCRERSNVITAWRVCEECLKELTDFPERPLETFTCAVCSTDDQETGRWCRLFRSYNEINSAT